MRINNKKVTLKESDVHQGHYVMINCEFTGKVINLYAYHTIEEYKQKVDKEIEELCNK